MAVLYLFPRFERPTADALAHTARKRVFETDVLGKNCIKLLFVIRLLLYFDTYLVEQGQGLVFLLCLSSYVVWHSIIGLHSSTTRLQSFTSNNPI